MPSSAFRTWIRLQPFGPIGGPEYLEYAKHINQSGEHLLNLINDILDLSRIEAGVVELREEIIDVASVARSCLVLVKARADEGGLTVESEVADDLPPLFADERKLKQILINLLTNAVKFTPRGGRVTLRAYHRPREGCVLQIADTGIAAENIPKALETFRQIDSDLKREYMSTGLGLPLTKSLAEWHDGSLELTSELGVGTTVTIRFPLRRVISALNPNKPNPRDTGDSAPEMGEHCARRVVAGR